MVQMDADWAVIWLEQRVRVADHRLGHVGLVIVRLADRLTKQISNLFALLEVLQRFGSQELLHQPVKVVTVRLVVDDRAELQPVNLLLQLRVHLG